MNIKKNKKLSSNRRKAIVILVTVVAIGGAITSTVLLRKHRSNTSKKSTTNTTVQETINYAPATTQEKKDAEAHKDSLVEDAQNNSSQPSSGKTVQPVITNADSRTISAYVPGVFEDGGTCTASFKNGGQSLAKNSSGFKNVSNTQCAPIDLDPGFLSSGTWTVTVSYSSATASGSSTSQTVRIP